MVGEEDRRVWQVWREENVETSSRQLLLARLDKAGGHINAAERRLWHQTERALWSGQQARARMSEAWAVFSGALQTLPPLERYLKRDVMRKRLMLFSHLPRPADLEAAWQEVVAAEVAIRAEPFPDLRGSLSDIQRRLLEAGLRREHRYINALRALLAWLEAAVSDRYLALRPGHWVAIERRGIMPTWEDGAWHWVCVEENRESTGRVLAIQGLTATVFMPEIAADAPGMAFDLHRVDDEHIRRIETSGISTLTSPGYYWLVQAWRNWRLARRLLRMMRGKNIADLDRHLLEVLDAAAKAWWATFHPEAPQVQWGYTQSVHVHALENAAPGQVAGPLIRCLNRLSAEVKAANGTNQNRDGWFQRTLLLAEMEQALASLEARVEDRVDLGAGDRVLLYGLVAATVVGRDGLKLTLHMGGKHRRKVRMFRDYLRPVSQPAEQARGKDPTENTVDEARLEKAVSDWEESVDSIVAGWRCIEEYQLDLEYRKIVDDLTREGRLMLSKLLQHRLDRADERFRRATCESRLPVPDCRFPVSYFADGISLMWPLNEYDSKRHWYFYRWPPDAPCGWRNHDLFSYQKEVHGLDFLNMTEEQLYDVVRR